MKACAMCHVNKESTDFYKSKNGPQGLSSYCKACLSDQYWTGGLKEKQAKNYQDQRDRDPDLVRRKMLKRYNITLEQFNDALSAQGNRCAICGTDNPDGKKDTKNRGTWNVDHDHACCGDKRSSCGNCFRGVLCWTCNAGLGLFRDDIQRLEKAKSYLLGYLESKKGACHG